MKSVKQFLAVLIGGSLLASCAAQPLGHIEVWNKGLRTASAVDPAGVELMSPDALHALGRGRAMFAVGNTDTHKPVELSGRQVIRVAMGPQPTPGYGFRLVSPSMSEDAGVATIQLEWVQPPKDAMLAQVITYPCIYLSLPHGDYHQVNIEDEKGVVRHSLVLQQ